MAKGQCPRLGRGQSCLVGGAGVNSPEYKPRVRGRVISQESEPRDTTGVKGQSLGSELKVRDRFPRPRGGRSRAGSETGTRHEQAWTQVGARLETSKGYQSHEQVL